MMSANTSAHSADKQLYAGLLIRVRAYFVDSIIIFLTLMVAIISAAKLGMPLIGWITLLIVILYDPVLVSRSGSTIGHRYYNLKVIRSSTGAIPNFPQALIRYITLLGLGWLSFLAMLFTGKHQAIHDMISKTIVVPISNDDASLKSFTYEQNADPQMPPAWRRVVVVLAYLAGIGILSFVLLIGLVESGFIGSQCYDDWVASNDLASPSSCNFIEYLILNVLPVSSPITIWVVIIGTMFLGAKGKLPGARLKRE
jgi:uncharacterized RDD family membrane protein YckC